MIMETRIAAELSTCVGDRADGNKAPNAAATKTATLRKVSAQTCYQCKNDEQRDENNENVDVNDSITIKLSRND
jgi:hypothetical protein